MIYCYLFCFVSILGITTNKGCDRRFKYGTVIMKSSVIGKNCCARYITRMFRRSCLCSLLTPWLSCSLPIGTSCKRLCIPFELMNKPCDWLKLATYTGTCSPRNDFGANNRTRFGFITVSSYFLIKVFTTVRLHCEKHTVFVNILYFS